MDAWLILTSTAAVTRGNIAVVVVVRDPVTSSALDSFVLDKIEPDDHSLTTRVAVTCKIARNT